MVLGLQN